MLYQSSLWSPAPCSLVWSRKRKNGERVPSREREERDELHDNELCYAATQHTALSQRLRAVLSKMGCSRCLATTSTQSCVAHLTCKYLLRDTKMGLSVFYYFRMCKIPVHMNTNAQPLCTALMLDGKTVIYNVLDDFDLQWLIWLQLVFCLSLSWSHSEFKTYKKVI